MLSEDMAKRFRAALRAHCLREGGAQDDIRNVVAGAAAEAHHGGVSAEQFVIWVKHVWDEILDEGALTNNPDPGRIREAVITSAIRAYYVQ